MEINNKCNKCGHLIPKDFDGLCSVYINVSTKSIRHLCNCSCKQKEN